MSKSGTETTRIAKNAVALYARSFITIIISLYTSRILLKTLGAEDLGVYNVVGGLVVLFGFLSGAMRATCQRFYNYAMGKPNEYNLGNVFSTAINIQVITAIILLVATEVLGLLLFNTLNIPEERHAAALWVFQFSVITLLIDTLSVPYDALIVAKEDMKAFAIIDVVNAVVRLLIIIAIGYVGFDKLILYAFLLLSVQVFTRFLYTSFCSRHYKDISYKFLIEKRLLKEMSAFSMWIIMSSVASILFTQGISIIYNIYYGVIVNAAIGIANQVRSVLVKLTSNMTISLGPQITVNYANERWDIVSKIWTVGSKCSLLLYAILSIPLMIDAEYVLKLWLVDPPEYTTLFLRLILMENLIRFLSTNASSIVRATGKVKNYELIVCVLSAVFFTAFALSVPHLKEVWYSYGIIIVMYTIQVFVGIFMACKCIGFNVMKYLLGNTLLSTIALLSGGFVAYLIRPSLFTIGTFILHFMVSVIVIGGFFYIIGLLPKEKRDVNTIIAGFINKKN